jgi:hypothetical protein
VQSRASSLKWEYHLLSLRSSNSFLRLLLCLPVTSISPCIFLSVTRCRRQFLLKMWPIKFAYRLWYLVYQIWNISVYTYFPCRKNWRIFCIDISDTTDFYYVHIYIYGSNI